MYYIAEGIDSSELESGTFVPMIAGDSVASLSIPFDTILCQVSMTGRVVFIEREGEVITRVGTPATRTTVVTGNDAFASVTPSTATVKNISGRVQLPTGLFGGFAYLWMQVDDAAVLLDQRFVIGNSLDYDFAAPEISGIDYRVTAEIFSATLLQYQWVHSDRLVPGTSGVNLLVPSIAQMQSPRGGGNSSTPTFSYTQITGANFNFSYFEDVLTLGSTHYWLGATTASSIALPDLPNPASLPAGTATNPNEYVWAILNSINVRGGIDSDRMLDGRQVKKQYFGIDARLNPSVIASGSYNFEAQLFFVP